MGTVTSVVAGTDLMTLEIGGASAVLSDAHLGDSIAVDGTCLTVTSFTSDTFQAEVSPETLRRTTLGSLKPSSLVNLERSALWGKTRVGGHAVQGHVDGTAAITSITDDGAARTFRFAPANKGLLGNVVEKGYIAVDGTSLTVVAVGEDWFEVMLVPYTQQKIATARKLVGDNVNIEVDAGAKYVEKLVKAYLGAEEGSGGLLERLVERVVERKVAEMMKR